LFGDLTVAPPRRAFSKQELDSLRALFTSLAAQSQTSGRAISRAVFLVSNRVSPQIALSLVWILLDLYDKSLTGVSLFVQKYYGVRGALGERLFQLVGKEIGGSDGVTLEDLIISKVGTSGLVLD